MPYTVILTAADPENNLDAIKEEFSELEACFNNVESSVVRAIINRNALDRGIFNAYLANNDIRLFHFSGHAGDGSLLLQDGRLAHGGILAAMMREAKYLQLVFLNGCATYELVNDFLDAGARLVIATSAPIGDKRASLFSSLFYKELCERNLSIGQSFDLARMEFKKRVEMTYGQIEVERHIYKPGSQKVTNFSWGIYHKERIDDDKIKTPESWSLINNEFTEALVEYQTPALNLVKEIAEAAIKISPFIPQDDKRVPTFKSISDNKQSASSWYRASTMTLQEDIQKILLNPLKEPFENIIRVVKLNTNIQIEWPLSEYEKMLEAQLSFHHVFVKIFAIIMWSDFMEVLILVNKKFEEDKDYDIVSTLIQKLNEHKTLQTAITQLITGNVEITNYDFCIRLCRKIISFMRDQRYPINKALKGRPIGPFIDESKNPEDNENPTELAKLEVLYQTLNVLDEKSGRSNKESLIMYCYRVEQALIELVQRFGYILKYELITVGKIQALAQRLNSSRKFLHAILTSAGLADDEDSESSYEQGFTESFSVLVVKNKKQFLSNLSLSPFLIDIGALMEVNKSSLLFFVKREKDYLKYSLSTTGKPEELLIHLKHEPSNQNFCVFPNTIKNMKMNTDLEERLKKRLMIARNQFEEFEALFLKLQNISK